VKTHIDQHAVLQSLTEHGYAGIDDWSKVHHLINGIKTDKYDSVKVQIMSSTTLRNSFDSCVTLYKDFIAQSTSASNPTLNISTTQHSVAKRSVKRKAPDDDEDVEDRYYNKEEYSRLSTQQKMKLKQLRKDRGSERPSSSRKSSRPQKNMAQKLAALEATVARLEGQKTSDDNDENDHDDEEPTTATRKGGNRVHFALTRQKRHKSNK